MATNTNGTYQRVLRKEFPHQSLKKHYESNDVTKKFEDIRLHLLKEGEDPTITNKILASIIYDLIVFQEKYLGIEAPVSQRKYTKIPQKLFQDYAPGGAVCIMLQTCFLFKYSQDWRRFDFGAPA